MFPIKRIAIISACLIAVPAFGQNRRSSESAQGILPVGFAVWTETARQPFQPGTQPASGGASANQANAAAAREYGFVSGETVTYSAPASDSAAPQNVPTLTATVYRMKDPTGAYGEYSYLRTPEMDRADFSDHSSTSANEALILVGDLVLDVTGANPKRNPADIKALVADVTPKAESGLFPTLPDRMPGENRVDKSDHYILGPQTLDQFFPGALGDSLGFTYGPEVETAHFHLDGRDVTMLIADFPTPQIAQGQLDSLSKKFDINDSHPVTGSAPMFASRTQTMISIIAGAPSMDSAKKLLDEVEPGTVLTWNEPTYQFKEPSINVMIVGAFVGTGIICLFTLAASLAFSGFRLTIKKIFPNTIFDRSAQMDILQMGLVSKPIKSEDFYAFDGKRIDDKSVDKNLPDRTALRLFK
jgi:uncharacterized protein DUF6599